MSSFQSFKLGLIDLFGLEKDALHIYVGLGVYLLTIILFRLKLSDPRALAVVFLTAAAGELVDLFEVVAPAGPAGWAGAWHDIWNTMFWPTVLSLLARSKRLLPT